MNLEQYVVGVQQQIAAAAALGDERTRQIADSLAATVQSAVRVAVLDALSAAGVELTDTLADAPTGEAVAVSVHLVGDEVRFGVTSTGPVEPQPVPVTTAEPDGTDARISLRLAESLKADIERAARTAEVSVNSWLIRAATTALRGTEAGHAARNNRRLTGWVTG